MSCFLFNEVHSLCLLVLRLFYEREESFDSAYFQSFTAKGIHFVQKSIN